MTTTGFEKRVIEAVPGVKKSRAQRIAAKLVKRQARMNEQFDFEESLRILGIITDTTARDAVANLEAVAA
ncbi:hypothetical protein [Arthrobacter rhombi]|uniref:hypothetical protein n=1 Tax=Arthrobacter rhombi TaxID=71253 RepID=UPI003FD25277